MHDCHVYTTYFEGVEACSWRSPWLCCFTALANSSTSSYGCTVEIWNKRVCCIESCPDNKSHRLVMWLLAERPHAFHFNSCACPWQLGSIWYCWQQQSYEMHKDVAVLKRWKHSNTSVLCHLQLCLHFLLAVSPFVIFKVQHRVSLLSAGLPDFFISFPLAAQCWPTTRLWACWRTVRAQRPRSGYKCLSLSAALTPTSSFTATSRSATVDPVCVSLWVTSCCTHSSNW